MMPASHEDITPVPLPSVPEPVDELQFHACEEEKVSDVRVEVLLEGDAAYA